jgi:CRISPR-associated endonuclease/helicase Cas3
MRITLRRPPVDHRLWGKWRGTEDLAPYPVACHLIDTAVIARSLWDLYLTPGQRRVIAEGWGVTEDHARDLVAFWAGLHDLGKACPGFQEQAPDATGDLLDDPKFPRPEGWHNQGSIRHERVSHLTAPALLTQLGYPGAARPRRSIAHQVGQILGGHHGRYGTALSAGELADPYAHEPRVGSDSWEEQRSALVGLVHDLCNTPEPPAQFATPAAAVLTTGVVILADWLASQTLWVRARQHQRLASSTDPENWAGHADLARAAAPLAIERAELVQPVWQDAQQFQDLFPFIAHPHPLQADIANTLPELVKGPGLVIVTAPTGDGKTETGLYAAHTLGRAAGAPGLAALLPTMATTDAMHRRIMNYARRTARTRTGVALLHSMAWLNSDNQQPGPDTAITDDCTATVIGEWLRGRHRGLLSGIAIGTWDTAALAALPVRYNALRWLGLSSKTIIIDEAHAYDAYGHALTARLLEWLGALQVPVILLSATLTGSIATQLATAYRDGTGHTDPITINPTYPGWTYIDATTGDVTTSDTIPTTRAREMTINVVHAKHTHHPNTQDSRARTILETLEPLTTTNEGAALVVCNTVADAQQTARMLRTQLAGAAAPIVVLLHARLPARQRAGITRRILRWTSPPDADDPASRRPQRPVIVVATQVIEQSLDVDFDHVISDLAPIALLLQRAGRCHRHARPRPAWAKDPAMTVIAPHGQLPPRHWGTVYPETLLTRTLTTLTEQPYNTIAIPGDVQHLVDHVYAHDWNTSAGIEHLATETAKRNIAGNIVIPTPTKPLYDLYPLSSHGDELDAVTRLGADSVRILPVYTNPDGEPFLDRPARHTPLPASIKPDDKSTIRDLMARTIQIDHRWLIGRSTETNTPPGWAGIGGLRDVLLLPHPSGPDGPVPYRLRGRALRLDQIDGLVRE